VRTRVMKNPLFASTAFLRLRKERASGSMQLALTA
jgi:hypothetical protein